MNLPSPLFEWINQRQQGLCHRQLLVISGEQNWASNAARLVLNEQANKQALWVGNQQMDIPHISLAEYKSKLGHEVDTLVLDCFSGFRPSAAMALAGTIRSQGLMILLCPELDTWPSYDDPEQHNRTSFGFTSAQKNSFFIQYFTRFLAKQAGLALLTAGRFSGSVFPIPTSNQDNFAHQEKALDLICKVAKGRNNRPLIMTADRGRGKSAALGIAAANLMQNIAINIALTAPLLSNVEQVFAHAKSRLPEANHTKKAIQLGASRLAFKPVDQLIQSDEVADLLLVDEAAGIPIHILLKLATKYGRVVFSSTVHGYEGSGRGFELKFKQLLSNLRPDCRHVHLSQPIRWHYDDPLEALWFNGLFYRSEHAQPSGIDAVQQITCKQISAAQLIQDHGLLEQVFSLLLDAHYQTSPDDLQRLLDAPDVLCFVLLHQNKVIAVAQVNLEGGEYLTPVSEQIAANSRRVKGHLAAQNLASSYHLKTYCEQKQWRISRIAVLPKLQRLGLATQLLQQIESSAKSQDIAYLTVAFGANPEMLKFWHQQQFKPAKISLKAEVSSGEHSCIHLKPLSDPANKLAKQIWQHFYLDFVFYLNQELKQLEPEVVIELLKQTEPREEPQDVSIINQFMAGSRPLTSCKRLLRTALLYWINNTNKLAVHERSFLCAVLLQNQDYAKTAKLYHLTGKKQIEQQVAALFSALL